MVRAYFYLSSCFGGYFEKSCRVCGMPVNLVHPLPLHLFPFLHRRDFHSDAGAISVVFRCFSVVRFVQPFDFLINRLPSKLDQHRFVSSDARQILRGRTAPNSNVNALAVPLFHFSVSGSNLLLQLRGAACVFYQRPYFATPLSQVLHIVRV